VSIGVGVAVDFCSQATVLSKHGYDKRTPPSPFAIARLIAKYAMGAASRIAREFHVATLRREYSLVQLDFGSLH
jgi:hypothetical protein